MKQFKELIICLIVVISGLLTIYTLERKDMIDFTTNTPTNSGVIEKKFYEIGGSVHSVEQKNYIVLHGSTKPILVDSYTFNSYSVGSNITTYKEEATVYLTVFVSLCVIFLCLIIIVFINILPSQKGYLDELKELHSKEKN